MAQKRPNLAALAKAAGSTRPELIRTEPAPEPVLEEVRPVQPPSRVGQKPITGYFPEEVRIQLKMLAAGERRSMESMIGEAFNDLFAKYGKAEIVMTDPT